MWSLWRWLEATRATTVAPIALGPSQQAPRSSSQGPGTDYAHHVVRGSAGPIRIDRHQERIEQFIPFSWLRLVSSVGGLALLLSDIPRTGLGTINFAQLYDSVAPDTQINYGPYDYPVVRLRRPSDHSNASSTEELEPVPLWPYKYDTLSIPTRSLATYLNVSSYPRCVLYERECVVDTLDHGKAFEMLDALITATAREIAGTSSMPFVFLTKSKWIDRLYQIISKRVGIVYHEVRLTQAFLGHLPRNSTSPLGLCHRQCRGRSRQATTACPPLPFFCALTVSWPLQHPTRNDSAASVSMGDHMEARLAQIRAEFPHLRFEMLTLASQYGYTSKRSTWLWSGLEAASFNERGEEILTLIRGQHCVQGDCVTEIIDDYRYERMYIEQNPKEVLLMTASLRGFAQAYIWLRVLCLWCGCYVARATEPTYSNASASATVAAAWRLFFRIPVHVVVYGSWLPVLAYSFAHYIDCGLFHMWFYALWSTMNGEEDFDAIAYFTAAAVQMRNTWILGVVVHILVLVQRYILGVRGGAPTFPGGIIGIRGFAIGLTSLLTVFAQIRRLSFRDSNIVDIVPLSPAARWEPTRFATPTEFGFQYEVMVLSFAFAFVVVVASIGRATISAVNAANDMFPSAGALSAKSHYVPFSIGSIGPTTAMGGFWKVGTWRDLRWCS
ncbi:TPA: hypothetical protein N0F65_011128 [Lagenidium giganteum]|uniref:Uncharacterized protein n=1 Tax=Lagenidium giganteum TaxID=4803 RepID=A0AAV2ZLY6_9STRA|nr:TPA: hypothetical protein N0F65_011128 [Lagenidium giganteum]